MAINQRDVYLLPFPINDGTVPHPFIVLSVKEANDLEGTFIGVMITASEYKDDFSFDLRDEMFENPLKKEGCHVRMHLLTMYLDTDIESKRLNVMKEFYFKQLLLTIGDLIFDCKMIKN